MQRWTTATIKTIALIVTAAATIGLALFLLLLSQCFGQGAWGPEDRNPSLALGFLIAALVVLGGGIWIVALQARGILRDVTPDVASDVPPKEFPRHLSAGSQAAVGRLVIAIFAQIVLGALGWICSLAIVPPIRNSVPMNGSFVAAGLLSNLPYIVLVIRLLGSPTRRTFSYAMAVPAILLVFGIAGGIPALFLLNHAFSPLSVGLLLAPKLLHAVVLYFAWKAMERIGLEPEPASLILASFLTLGYFLVLPFAITFIAYFTGFISGPGSNSPVVSFLTFGGPALIVLIAGAFVSTLLYKRMSARSSFVAAPASLSAPVPVVSHTEPARSDQKIIPSVAPYAERSEADLAVWQLISAIVVQFVLGDLPLLASLHLDGAVRARYGYAPFPWWQTVLQPVIALQLPYAALCITLRKKLSASAFAYALVVPCIMGLFYLVELPFAALNYHSPWIELNVALTVAPLLAHVVVLYLAARAIRVSRVHLDAPAVVVAALVTALYFSMVHLSFPLLYRLNGP